MKTPDKNETNKAPATPLNDENAPGAQDSAPEEAALTPPPASASSIAPLSRRLLPALADRASGCLEVEEVEAWPEAVDGQVLLTELKCLVKRFVLLPEWAEEALALWILHTYAFELRDVTAYLGIESPEKRCGKTTLLTVLSELVNRPVVASNISPPAFFRVIEETRPTLLIDEADTFLHGNDALRGILNAGYSRKTAFVVRVGYQPNAKCKVENEGAKARKPNEAQSVERRARNERPKEGRISGTRLMRFSCWCPKVLAAIGHLPDTLADRCILIRMERKRADEKCERIKSLDGLKLRQQCARFVLEHGVEIARAQPQIPSELNDRTTDVWEPLLALADLAGGDWPERARQAAIHLGATAQENDPIGSLLMDIWVQFVRGKADRLFSRTLVDALNSFENRPWGELIGRRTASAPQGVTDLWLAQKLRRYGVKPKMIRIGEDVGRGYTQKDLQETFRRYIPRTEIDALKEELALRRETQAKQSKNSERSAPVL